MIKNMEAELQLLKERPVATVAATSSAVVDNDMSLYVTKAEFKLMGDRIQKEEIRNIE